jgi:hypothetical protein
MACCVRGTACGDFSGPHKFFATAPLRRGEAIRGLRVFAGENARIEVALAGSFDQAVLHCIERGLEILSVPAGCREPEFECDFGIAVGSVRPALMRE